MILRVDKLILVAASIWFLPCISFGQEVGQPKLDGPSAGATAGSDNTVVAVPNEEVPKAFWEKANQWIGNDQEEAGRLLMRDLERDYSGTAYGRMARDWLSANKDLDRSGRVEFIIASTLMGAYFGYSTMLGITTLNDSLDSDEVKAAVWSSVGGAGAGLVGSVLASQYMSISSSQARLFTFLGWWGWANGFFIYDIARPLEDHMSEGLLWGGLGMAGGLALSLALWDRLNVPEGTAELSVGMAAYTAYFFTLGNFFFGGPEAYSDHEKVSILMTLLPATGAFVGGFFLGPELDWGVGDVRLIELGGFLGGLVSAALLVSFEPGGDDDEFAKKVTGTMALGTAAGLIGAALIVQPWDKGSSGQSAENYSPRPALVNYGTDGWGFGTPLPNVYPRIVEGQRGVALEMPVLSIAL